jgi:hypothetical protein
MNVEQQLDRIQKVHGVDFGLFVLAVHSFAEGVMNVRMGNFEEHKYLDANGKELDPSFYKKVGIYADFLTASYGWNTFHEFQSIKDTYSLSNEVRHKFAQLTMDEVRSSIHSLRKFCRLSRISSPVLESLGDELKCRQATAGA